MATTGPNPLDRLRQPEYTGENRCVPCTAVNVVIAAGLAGAIAVAIAAAFGTQAGTAAGLAAFVLAAVIIYLRGYLVPGTPWFTRTYFPDWLLRRFDKEPTATAPTGTRAETVREEGRDDGAPVEETLKDAGVIEECEHEDDLCLTDGFRDAWQDRIAGLRDGVPREDVAAVFEVDAEALSFEAGGDAFSVRADGRLVGRWESRAAFLADLAVAGELRERCDGWAWFGVGYRRRLLTGLRVFLERCPACDGPIDADEEVVESCCRSIDVIAVTCRDCGARVFEAEKPA